MVDMKQLADIIDNIESVHKMLDSYTKELVSANKELSDYTAKDKNDTLLYLQYASRGIRDVDVKHMLVEFHVLTRMMPTNIDTLIPNDTKYPNTWKSFLSSISKSYNYVTCYSVGFIRELIGSIENANTLVYSETT